MRLYGPVACNLLTSLPSLVTYAGKLVSSLSLNSLVANINSFEFEIFLKAGNYSFDVKQVKYQSIPRKI